MKVLFYPDKIHEYSKMHRYMNILGYDMVFDPDEPFDIAVLWSHHKTILRPDERLTDLMRKNHFINAGGLDITKIRIEQVMMDVFGYNALVDPLNTEERVFISKNDRQTRHDIKVVNNGGTSRAKPGRIYLKLLGDKVNEYYRTYRCFVVGNKISASAETLYPIAHRFDHADKRIMVKPSSWLSKTERRLIVEFCAAHGTELTELDVIRNRDDAKDGRIYIVDNNNIPARATPWPGPEAYDDNFYNKMAPFIKEFMETWA